MSIDAEVHETNSGDLFLILHQAAGKTEIRLPHPAPKWQGIADVMGAVLDGIDHWSCETRQISDEEYERDWGDGNKHQSRPVASLSCDGLLTVHTARFGYAARRYFGWAA